MAFASILIARLLGPENYGLYALALITPSFFIAVGDLGISAALTRFSALFRSEGKGQKVVGLIKAGIIFKLVSSLLLSLVLLLLSESIGTWVLRRPGIDLLIRFTSLYLVGQAIFMALDSVFIGLDKTENSSLLTIAQALIKIVVSPLLIILGMGAIGAIIGIGLGFLLATGIGITVLLPRLCPGLCSASSGDNIDLFGALRLMVPYGMPLYLSTLILSLLTQYRGIILAQFVSNMGIGNYTIAMNFSVLIIIFSQPIAISLFPAFSKLSIKKDRDILEKMFKLSVKYTSLLVIPASLALCVLSNEVVYALYGSQYRLAPSYLALYVLYFLCAGLGMFVIASFFNGQGDTKATFKMDLVNVSLSVPLTLIFTFLYGVPGLMASLVTSQFVSTTYGLFLARKKYALTVDWASSFRILVASLCSALLVYVLLALIPIPLFKLVFGGFLYVISFLGFAPLLRAISKEDVANLDELLKGLVLIYPIARSILNLEKRILSLHIAI